MQLKIDGVGGKWRFNFKGLFLCVQHNTHMDCVWYEYSI
jgi:hypothetical protein